MSEPTRTGDAVARGLGDSTSGLRADQSSSPSIESRIHALLEHEWKRVGGAKCGHWECAKCGESWGANGTSDKCRGGNR